MDWEREIAVQSTYFNQLNTSEKLRLLNGSNDEILRRLHQESILFFNQTVMDQVQKVIEDTETNAVSAWDGYLGFVNAIVGFFDTIHPGKCNL